MHKLLSLLLILLCTIAHGQTPSGWAWLYGASNAAATSITSTPNGDMYVFGRFYETATFGNKTITSAGSTDVFIAKINAAGTLVWLKQMGSNNIERAYAIKTHNNAIYIYGGFTDTLLLGSNKLISKGSEDVFVAKLDTAGNFIWTESGGSPHQDFIYSRGMTVDKKGNVYITGELRSDQPAIFGNKTITNNIYGGLFVVKYNTTGYTEWAICGAADSGKSAGPLDINTDENDYVIITGWSTGKALTFGPTSSGNNTIAGPCDAFLVKLNPSGNVVWTTTIGGNSGIACTAICCDKNSNVFVTGQSDGDLTFGTIISPGGVSGKNTELFLAKYDSNGNALWAKRAGTHGSSPIYTLSKDIISDNAGCVYWTGGRGDTMDFYSNGVIACTPIKYGGGGVFVAKYDGNGNALWAIDGGGNTSAEAMKLHLCNQSLFVSGSFYTTDSTTFGKLGFKANSNKNENLFIAKIANATGIKSSISVQSNIALYPNPAENYFIVSGIARGAEISMYDITGRKIRTVIAISDRERIETKDFAKGNYTVIITSASEEIHYKLTKL